MDAKIADGPERGSAHWSHFATQPAPSAIAEHLNVFAENWTGAQPIPDGVFTMHKRLSTEALEILRTCLDLADVDLRPSAELLSGLLDLDDARLAVLTGQLRAAGLLQKDRYGLTMPGLAVAAAMPSVEPRPMMIGRRAAVMLAS